MEEQIQKIRKDIAIINEKIKQTRQLKTELKENFLIIQTKDRAKITKIEQLFSEKLGNKPDADPQKQIVLQKIEDMKALQIKKQQESQTELQKYEDEIDILVRDSADLTKELLLLVA